MSKILEKVATELYTDGTISPSITNSRLASKMTTALSTVVEGAYGKQVAIINVVDLMKALNNPYSFIDKGELGYGIGEQTMSMRFKTSEASNTTIDPWLPSGAVEGLPRIQSVTTGAIQRKVTNAYSEVDMREYVRDANTFANLLNLESTAGAKTKQRENREMSRYLFGINVSDKLLPADYKAAIKSVKDLIVQNRIPVSTTTDYKSIVNYLQEFADNYYANYSNKYNAACDPTKTGDNLWVGGVDSGVEAMMNSAEKENTVLIISTKFRNKLRQELGNTYNPDYWLEFTSRFGQVIEDTFEDDSIMYILDKETIASMSVFSEYTNTYYPNNSAFQTINKWKDYYRVIPFMNLVSFKFTKTKAVKETKTIEAKTAKTVEVKPIKLVEPTKEVEVKPIKLVEPTKEVEVK